MYQITCDDYILHDQRLDGLCVINPKCELEVNKTGSLTFQILPTHPYYNRIKKHTSEITLYQDNEILFRGRVLNDEISFDNIKEIECEGELSYFLDSIQRGKEYNFDDTSGVRAIETVLKDLVSIHNSQVDERKRFVVGTVNVYAPYNEMKMVCNYEDTLSILTDKLIENYGGYLMVRHDGNIKYLDYVSELTNVCNQVISFGKNIVDMTRFIKGEDIYTALIPLGKTISTSSSSSQEGYEKRLTISSIADSVDESFHKVSDYVYHADAVKQWGWIWKVIKWDDVDTAGELLKKAKGQLKNAVNTTFTIEMTAIDLHLLDVNVDRIRVGDKIQCISLPHNLNTILSVKSMSIDIDDPSKTTIKLASLSGKTYLGHSISSGNKDNEKKINNVKEILKEGYPSYKDLDTKFEDFKDWASDTFLPQGADGSVDLTGYARISDVNSAFSELANAIEGV